MHKAAVIKSNDVCKNCYFHIRALHHVRSSLLDDVVRTVACVAWHSRVLTIVTHYSQAAGANLSKLQRVQNTLARGKYEQLTPALSELHWLPVRQRIDFKVATLTFKVRQSGYPTYFSQQLSDYTPNRSLRSASQHRLQTQPTRTGTTRFYLCSSKNLEQSTGRSPKMLYSGNFQTQT